LRGLGAAARRENPLTRHAVPIRLLGLFLGIDEPVGQVAAERRVPAQEIVEPVVSAVPRGEERPELDRLVEMAQDGSRLVAQREDLGLGCIPGSWKARDQDVDRHEKGREDDRPGDGLGALTRSARGHGAQDAAEISSERRQEADAAAGHVDGGPKIEPAGKREREQAEQEEHRARVSGDPQRVLHAYLQRCDAMAVRAAKSPSAVSERK
jgi:hypothetical protein